MDKDGDMEDVIGVEIQVLNNVVPEHSFEEFTGGECQSTLHEPGEHRDFIWFFSIGYGSSMAIRHRSITFSRRNPLLTRASRSSVFSVAFFHSLVGLGKEWKAAMTPGRHLRLHYDFSSSMHRSSSSLPGMSSSSK
jgi:hypothetical protein